MTTLTEYIIVAGVENRPLMLEKSMYDSWASRIRLFIQEKKNGRMMLDSIDNGPLAAKDIWDRVKLLMKGTELSYQERECGLYNLFDKFASVQVRIMREIYPETLALVANSQTLYNPSQSLQHYVPSMHPSHQQFTPVYAPLTHHQHHHTPVNPLQQSVSPQLYISLSVTQQSQTEFPQLDSSLVVPTFQQGEDPIECINKAMEFLYAVASRFPPSNNQLRTLSNPRNQATIQDGRITVQQVQGRQTQSFVGIRNKGIATTLRGNSAAGQPRILDEEQLAFIADPGVEEAQVAQQTIPHNSTFQTKDLDAYDSDCDDISSAKAVLMAILSSCDSDVLSKVPYSDTYLIDMINQDEQEMSYSKQIHIVDFPDNKVTSDSNIIPYSQYLQET
ncbi:hypothetical protein Tco_0592734 [Tanacetum coccineum]